MLHHAVLLNYGHVQKELMVDALNGILLHQTLRDEPKDARRLCLANAVVLVHGIKLTCRFQLLL